MLEKTFVERRFWDDWGLEIRLRVDLPKSVAFNQIALDACRSFGIEQAIYAKAVEIEHVSPLNESRCLYRT